MANVAVRGLKSTRNTLYAADKYTGTASFVDDLDENRTGVIVLPARDELLAQERVARDVARGLVRRGAISAAGVLILRADGISRNPTRPSGSYGAGIVDAVEEHVDRYDDKAFIAMIGLNFARTDRDAASGTRSLIEATDGFTCLVGTAPISPNGYYQQGHGSVARRAPLDPAVRYGLSMGSPWGDILIPANPAARRVVAPDATYVRL